MSPADPPHQQRRAAAPAQAAPNDPASRWSGWPEHRPQQEARGSSRSESPWLGHLAQLWRQPWAASAVANGDIAAAFRVLQKVGVSQRRIAALTEQSQSEISEILTGRQVRDIRVLTRLVDALHLPRAAFGLAPADNDPTNPDRPAGDPTPTGEAVPLPERCLCGGPVEPDPPPSKPDPSGLPPDGPVSRPVPSIDDIPTSMRQADVVAGPPSPVIEILTPDAARRLTVALWTGAEVRMLRLARRMSMREFAIHLGVSDRIVSKWEAAGRAITPSPVNQDALDTSLNLATFDERARFTVLWRQAWPTTPPDPSPSHRTGRRRESNSPDPGPHSTHQPKSDTR